MKVKVTELSGAALDWAVAAIEGWHLCHDGINPLVEKGAWLKILGACPSGKPSRTHYTPSTDWSQGGPIIEKERLCVGCKHQPDPNYCPTLDPDTLYWARTTSGGYLSYGPTPLIAAMRCYVRNKLGDEVDIPDALSGGPHA